VLYNVAEELGATKIALGHHRDDVIETLVLNLFYSGQMKAMPPRLRSDDGRNVVIRPLVYCSEEDLAAFATERAFPIIPCDLCGSQDNLQRKRVKELLTRLNAENPNVRATCLGLARGNVRPTHPRSEVRARLALEEASGPPKPGARRARCSWRGLVLLSLGKSAEPSAGDALAGSLRVEVCGRFAMAG
jgi:tRNA 2-thiocytidine biosynthesis protein TtcA